MGVNHRENRLGGSDHTGQRILALQDFVGGTVQIL